MLENKIDTILKEISNQVLVGHLYAANYYSLICDWTWSGKPRSLNPDLCDNRTDKVTYEEVDWLIRSAPRLECETSPSEYIRECKRWFDAQRS